MNARPIPVTVATNCDGTKSRAMALVGRHTTTPNSGSGNDRESALAKALHRSRVFYADADVERDVLIAEGKCGQVDLLLVGDVLHALPMAA